MKMIDLQIALFTTLYLYVLTDFLSPLLLIFSLIISALIPITIHVLLPFISRGWIGGVEDPSTKNRLVSQNLWKIAIFNIFVTFAQGIIMIKFGCDTGRIDFNLWPRDATSLTGWFKVFWQLLFMLLASDLLSYGYHRWCHENKWVLKNIHFMHHEYIHPDHAVFALYYVAPLDMIISNLLYMSTILMIQTDLFTVLLFGTVSSLITCFNHCGVNVDFPWTLFSNGTFHMKHHVHSKFNYAEHFKFIDRIFGTVAE